MNCKNFMGYVETSSPKGVLRSRRTAASCELQPYWSVKFNETRQILLQLLKRVCVCGRSDRFRFRVKWVLLYAAYRLGVSPYKPGSPQCLGIPLVPVCNSCTGLQGKNYLFRPSCYHIRTGLFSLDALFRLLKMLTKKFTEVN